MCCCNSSTHVVYMDMMLPTTVRKNISKAMKPDMHAYYASAVEKIYEEALRGCTSCMSPDK